MNQRQSKGEVCEVCVRCGTHPLWVREDLGHVNGDGHLVDPQVWVGGDDGSAGEIHPFP